MVTNPYLSQLQRLRSSERVAAGCPDRVDNAEGQVVLDLPEWSGLTVGAIIPAPYGWREVVSLDPTNPLVTGGVVVLRDGAGNEENWSIPVLLRKADQYTRHGVKKLWTIDPSPAVGTHGPLWEQLLGLAYDIDEEKSDGVFAALRGARCWGADVEWAGRSWRLVRGEMEAEDWVDIKERYLRPNLNVLKTLLGQVGEP